MGNFVGLDFRGWSIYQDESYATCDAHLIRRQMGEALEPNRRIREATKRAEKAEAALVLAQREIDRLILEVTTNG